MENLKNYVKSEQREKKLEEKVSKWLSYRQLTITKEESDKFTCRYDVDMYYNDHDLDNVEDYLRENPQDDIDEVKNFFFLYQSYVWEDQEKLEELEEM